MRSRRGSKSRAPTQSHISNKNLDRLRQHTSSPDPMIANAAAVVLQVAVIAPYKRKRLRVLRRVQPDLIAAVIDLGPLHGPPLTIEQDWRIRGRRTSVRRIWSRRARDPEGKWPPTR